MADFSQALQWMKEGKKVRRYCFSVYAYYKIVDGKIVDMDENDDFCAEIDSEDILSDDWEIYTEPMSDETKSTLINFAEMLSNNFLNVGTYRGLYVKEIIVEKLKEAGVDRD